MLNSILSLDVDKWAETKRGASVPKNLFEDVKQTRGTDNDVTRSLQKHHHVSAHLDHGFPHALLKQQSANAFVPVCDLLKCDNVLFCFSVGCGRVCSLLQNYCTFLIHCAGKLYGSGFYESSTTKVRFLVTLLIYISNSVNASLSMHFVYHQGAFLGHGVTLTIFEQSIV